MKLEISKIKRLFVMIMVTVTMAVCVAGCGSDEKVSNEKVSNEKVSGEEKVYVKELGEGAITFSFVVVDKDGNETAYEISTDKEMVGDALIDHNLIEGDEGEYGMYVKKVNGITAEFEKDGTYWAFYIDGEYAMTGVDVTPVTKGASYMFKVEK